MKNFVRDILFPTELTGRKRQCVSYKLPDGLSGYYLLPVHATGKRVRLCWNFDYSGQLIPYRPAADIVNANNQTINYLISNVENVKDGMIYLNCTNVTELSINGTILI